MEKRTFYLIADIIHQNRTWIKVIDTERLIEMRIPQDGVLKNLFYKAITLQSYSEHYSFIKSRTWNISEYDLNQGVAALCRKTRPHLYVSRGYLRLLIEADEKLSKDPEIDQMSPSNNIQLNRYSKTTIKCHLFVAEKC